MRIKSCEGLLEEIINLTEPDLSDDKVKAKIDKWMNEPSIHFGGSTPNEVIKAGKERKVKLLLEQIM